MAINKEGNLEEESKAIRSEMKLMQNKLIRIDL